MDFSLWAITGFQIESFDTVPPTEEDLKYYFDARFIQTTKIIGQLTETPKTVMHGVSSMGHDKPTGYAFVEVSLQRMEDFEKTPLDGRGLGAVTGGFITSTIIGADGGLIENTAVDEQQWGVIDTSKARHLCGFYSSKLDKFYHVMICFARTNVAAVSGFWRNGKVIIGPDVQCRETDWGADIRSNPCILYRYSRSGPPRIRKPPVGAGNHTLVLEEVKRANVLGVDFPRLLSDGEVKTVKPELVFSQVLTNGSSATFKDTFNTKTTLLDTHTFDFEEGSAIDWSAEWKAKVPLVQSETRNTVKIDVSFKAHQLSTTSKTQRIDRTAEITLPPMNACKATVRYVKDILTVGAILTVRKTYTNGAVLTCEVPAKYTSVSCDSAEVKLEGIPVVPTSVI